MYFHHRFLSCETVKKGFEGLPFSGYSLGLKIIKKRVDVKIQFGNEEVANECDGSGWSGPMQF